jgi:hypothetical protein
VSKNPEFYADFRSGEIVQKNAPEKVRRKKHFFLEIWADFLAK